MALANDFFGLDTLGYDPYHQQKVDTLSRYQQIDQLVGQQAQTGTNDGVSPTQTQPQQMDSSSSYPAGNTGISGMGDLAAYNMTAGTGGTYQTASLPPDPDVGNVCPPGQYSYNGQCRSCPEPGDVWDAQQGCHNAGTPPAETGCPSGQVKNDQGVCVPMQVPNPGGAEGQNPAPGSYPNSTNTNTTNTSTTINSGGPYSNSTIPNDIRFLRTQLGQYLGSTFDDRAIPYLGNLEVNRWDSPYIGQAANAGQLGMLQSNQYGGLFRDLIGGLQGAYPGLQDQLNAIDTQGKGQLQDISAQIREQYGAMGLGAGTDVSEALGRGMSRGMADIQLQKTNALSGAWEGQQNRLLGAAGTIPGMTTSQLQGYQGYGNLLAQLGGMDIGLQGDNISRTYEEFVRRQTKPNMDYALGMATGFPPNPNPKPVVQGGGTMSWLGPLLGSIGSAAILASDRDVKEDVVPFKGSVLAALRDLEVSTWRYNGESTVHIGPMAQDMKRLFGVGDGKTIHVVDVVGILMQAAKELANAQTS
jgi:hypothetical protein